MRRFVSSAERVGKYLVQLATRLSQPVSPSGSSARRRQCIARLQHGSATGHIAQPMSNGADLILYRGNASNMKVAQRPRRTARFRRYELVSVCGIWAQSKTAHIREGVLALKYGWKAQCGWSIGQKTFVSIAREGNPYQRRILSRSSASSRRYASLHTLLHNLLSHQRWVTMPKGPRQ